VSQAGVNDLVAAFDDGLGGGAVGALMGTSPEEDGDRYALASPAARLPIGVPQVLVHGTADDVVPLDQSVAYARRADAAGDEAELVDVDGADHFDVIDPGHEAWRQVVTRLEKLLT
jgi:pimeloyl-ACP methyl ester carboxylesterase